MNNVTTSEKCFHKSYIKDFEVGECFYLLEFRVQIDRKFSSLLTLS